MFSLSCRCSEVRLACARRPDFIHQCNCALCHKSGARWGYSHPSEVRVEGATRGYRRADKDEPSAEIQFCPNCGANTHFVLTQSAVAKF